VTDSRGRAALTGWLRRRCGSRVPAVPDPLRRPITIMVGICTLGLAALVAAYAGVEGPGVLDTTVDRLVQENFEQHRAFMRRLVKIGSPRWLPVLVGFLVLTSLVLSRPRIAFVTAAGVGLTVLAASVLQPTVGRTLEGNFALPSGHTSGAVAISAAASLLLISVSRAWLPAVAVASALVVLGMSLVVAAGLIVNGLHYTTDTVAGFCTAVAIVYGLALLVDRVLDPQTPARSHVRPPPPRDVV
jgi:membrane-associated phospholipid phosphatase